MGSLIEIKSFKKLNKRKIFKQGFCAVTSSGETTDYKINLHSFISFSGRATMTLNFWKSDVKYESTVAINIPVTNSKMYTYRIVQCMLTYAAVHTGEWFCIWINDLTLKLYLDKQTRRETLRGERGRWERPASSPVLHSCGLNRGSERSWRGGEER